MLDKIKGFSKFLDKVSESDFIEDKDDLLKELSDIKKKISELLKK